MTRLGDGEKVNSQISLLAVAALAGAKIAQSSQEVNLSQVGPEGFHKVKLAVSALPQHEVTQALLARGSDY